MKPFDNAHSQAMECQQEADRYGFVVVAPELRAPDVLGEFPVKRVHPAFKSDDDATMAILDHVFSTTQADSKHVLSTSWSSGGYMAHYMMNRHPDTFTCLAVRQSNFSAAVLDAEIARRSSGHPILILNTENDFGICVEESRQAREWYQARGYKNVAWAHIKSLGHERTPDLAADFFGQVCSIEPLTAPTVLTQRQAIAGNAEGLAFLTGRPATARTSPNLAAANPPKPSSGSAASPTAKRESGPRARPNPPTATAQKPPTQGRPAAPATMDPVAVRSPQNPGNKAPAASLASQSQMQNPQPQRTAPGTPPRLGDSGRSVQALPKRPPLGIRVSSAIAVEQLHLSYSAECPLDWYESASFLWTLDGKTLGTGINGEKTIIEPGEHTLGLLVVTSEGEEFRTSRNIRVLPRLSSASNARGN